MQLRPCPARNNRASWTSKSPRTDHANSRSGRHRSSQYDPQERADRNQPIFLARENVVQSGPDYLPEMIREILQVISKYIDIDLDKIQVNVEKDSDCEILELNIPLSEAQEKQQRKAAV